jgi:hypothetical protein
MMMLTREGRITADEPCDARRQRSMGRTNLSAECRFRIRAGGAQPITSRFSALARGTPLAAFAAMNAICAGCGRTIPEFSRVCEHCGHCTAEQILLPTFALSLQPGPESDLASQGFDFSPDALPEPPPISSADLQLYEASFFESGAPREVAPGTPEVEPSREEVSATPSPGPLASTEAPGEPEVLVSSTGLLFGGSPAAAGTVAEPPVRSKRREIVFVTLAAAISGVLTLGWLLARTAPGAEVTVAAAASSNPPAAVPRSTPADVVPAARAHQWTSANSAVWAGDMRNAIAFEVEAENTVGVWMRTVRPALIIRCSAGTVEAFVFTASAARIEPRTDDHTVQLSVDGASQVTEHWRDSEEHDALFAPDGGAFMRQLLTARVMRFGFIPHNAMPVTAEFNVAGLAAMLDPVSRQCGIK